MKTYIEKKRIFADALDGLNKEGRQLALYVDQMIQRLFAHIDRNKKQKRGSSRRHIRRGTETDHEALFVGKHELRGTDVVCAVWFVYRKIILL